MDSKKVFISYSHDSPEHAARVAGLAASLRRDGVDCRIDQYLEASPPEGWPLWMEKTLEWADFVLIVCTETYHRRVRKEEKPGKGHGATWEAHLIYQQLYEAHLFNAKFIPVIFDGADKEFIPTPLRGGGYYRLDDQTGYDGLYVVLTGQHKPTPDLGKVKKVRREPAAELFAEPGGARSHGAAPALKESDLKVPDEEPYPDEPYPVLLPYTHPELFAGRERELAELRRRLNRPIPILGVFSTSGAGKSSLLRAGLIPALHNEKHPVAYWAEHADPLLAAHLLDCLLEESAGHRTLGDDQPERFVEYLQAVRRLSGKDPVLIVDQFEELMESSDGRARIGLLLAASVQWSLCRWVLCYRDEYHGRVMSWLNDVLREAREKIPERLEKLPYDLSGHFQSWSLEPFATAPGGSDSTRESIQAFLSAIEAPLKIKEDGKPKYGILFADGAAKRLATAFAETRAQQPPAPLLPELQVVLAHLYKKSPEIQVPENPEELIGRALVDHLRRAIEDVADTPRRRAEVLVALCDLATKDGRRNEGRAFRTLAATLGEDGAAILKKLSNDHRVIYREPGEKRCILSHDRVAEAVVAQAEDPETHRWLDKELVELRRLVAHKVELYETDKTEALNLTPTTLKRIERQSKTFGLDHELDAKRGAWWAALMKRKEREEAEIRALRLERRRKMRKWMTRVAALILALGTVVGYFWGYAPWYSARIDELSEELRQEDRLLALKALLGTHWWFFNDTIAEAKRADGGVLVVGRERKESSDSELCQEDRSGGPVGKRSGLRD